MGCCSCPVLRRGAEEHLDKGGEEGASAVDKLGELVHFRAAVALGELAHPCRRVGALRQRQLHLEHSVREARDVRPHQLLLWVAEPAPLRWQALPCLRARLALPFAVTCLVIAAST